ncbi:hypothetical protein [Sulfobacillus thermosulfidooxidans]|uniref:hypothetical protein n=1 Tax=Sulfobacillus thermosulfidooxidans TaxID=28034 RepID=UPI0006B55388|nr:hypothetical protein [Sulfobacillus thermosulfidooxidans]
MNPVSLSPPSRTDRLVQQAIHWAQSSQNAPLLQELVTDLVHHHHEDLLHHALRYLVTTQQVDAAHRLMRCWHHATRGSGALGDSEHC